ncbi:MAG: nicotinate phosphoribosyltransferase [Candidatus Paraprevotella stercoravium]|uniref:Nicotinate phosphoribosyltransferase n=1 Tax=Candidatus Paraprevotella stercoravium TaxID=2838725 RepID=A0A9E2P1W3_9BACT|nr:nicotinate phosphoribosyltransferase [Candidatus Paraprevotella stercoravium]
MIIQNILDTDLYKFTTSYAYIKLFPYAEGTFTFQDRDQTVYTEEFLKTAKREIEKLREVKLTSEEQEFMTHHCRFLPPVYWEWLASFRFNPEKIDLRLDEEGHLHMEVTDLLYKVTLYEVPLLAIISEVKNKFEQKTVDLAVVREKLAPKIALSNENGLPFSEFGTRRRFSKEVHETVIRELKKQARYCTGTSNCYLAMKYDMRPMGTHPHEWFMFHGAQFGYKHANYMALENWVNVYDGDLGTALSDTYTSESFLSNFSRKQAKLFDGVRCDSGDEFRFVDQLIDRYQELSIDPTTKTIIFSNALDFPKALELFRYCQGRIRCSFGIGTNLTNDTGYPPANIVMKLSRCRMNSNQQWRECIKLSDDLGKHMGSITEVEACMHELRIS